MGEIFEKDIKTEGSKVMLGAPNSSVVISEMKLPSGVGDDLQEGPPSQESQENMVGFGPRARTGMKCAICQGNFSNKCSLKAHMDNLHSDMKVSCIECGKICGSQLSLNQHVKIVHCDPTHPCPTCGKLFKTKTSLTNHIDTVHDKNFRHHCQFCSKGVDSKFKLKQHERCHTGEKAFFKMCEICQKDFSTKASFQSHMDNQHGDVKIPCVECGKMFGSQRSLHKHVKAVHCEATHLCPTCNKLFKTKYEMIEHVETVHDRKFRYHCQFCGQGARNQFRLKEHERCHTGEKMFFCDKCPAKVHTARDLKYHTASKVWPPIFFSLLF